jgi:hypothetical protein
MKQAGIAAALAVAVAALAACRGEPQPAAEPAAAASQFEAAPASPAPAPVAAAAQLPEEVCQPGEDSFRDFFNEYVAREEVRAAYTAPSVQVRRFADPAKVLAEEPAAPAAFKVVQVDFQWSYREPEGSQRVPDRVELALHPQGQAMRMEFRRAEYAPDDELVRTFGEPGAYVFERRDGCWRLTQELR